MALPSHWLVTDVRMEGPSMLGRGVLGERGEERVLHTSAVGNCLPLDVNNIFTDPAVTLVGM